jgi:hypothetical protein
MADIDDLFTPPNAGAYEKEELRKGPPLTYVGEKAENCPLPRALTVPVGP